MMNLVMGVTHGDVWQATKLIATTVRRNTCGLYCTAVLLVTFNVVVIIPRV